MLNANFKIEDNFYVNPLDIVGRGVPTPYFMKTPPPLHYLPPPDFFKFYPDPFLPSPLTPTPFCCLVLT